MLPRRLLFIYYTPRAGHQHSRKSKNVTRFSWLNCALRDDEAVYWVSIGQQQWLVFGGTILSHYEAVIDVIGSVEGNDTFIQ